jgi:outer membrane murein-binding lipoprotein Lpp
MKASMLGLLAAATAFGGSSIYLWTQLQAERDRAAQLATQSADLNARIAQLEQARNEFGQRRLLSASTFGGQAMGGSGKALSPPSAGEVTSEAASGQMTPWSVRPAPPRSEAMQKMMRAGVRAHNKRMYADVGAALGLDKNQANKLIDLLTDQQSGGGFEPFGEGKEAGDFQNAWAEKQRKLQAEINDLLGDDKAASLQEYQKSLPARQELEMLTRQLEGYDAPINDDQRKRLLKVMVEERERVPAPDYVDSTDMEEFQKARAAWEEDYNQRVASQARNILDTDQLNAYTEYQQGQKDMRAQFGVMMPAGAQRVMRGPNGNSMTFSTAAPIGGAVLSADAVYVTASPESGAKK